jgi:hypothetical protein
VRIYGKHEPCQDEKGNSRNRAIPHKPLRDNGLCGMAQKFDKKDFDLIGKDSSCAHHALSKSKSIN